MEKAHINNSLMRQKAFFFLFFASHKINKSLLKSEKNQHMKKTVCFIILMKI